MDDCMEAGGYRRRLKGEREGAKFIQFWDGCKVEQKCSMSPYSWLLANPDFKKDYNKHKKCTNPDCKGGWIVKDYWPDQDCPDCEANLTCGDCGGDGKISKGGGVEVDCNACRGAGNVDIPKWRKKALDILNNGSAVAALKHTKTFVNATVSYVETNETLAKLKQKWKGMKKLKRRYNDLVRKGRMKEAWIVKKKLLGSGVKEIGAAFIYVNVMEYGIQFNTISDFINNASLDKDPMAQGWDLGKGLCRDLLSFYNVPTEKKKWLNLGKSIYKIGQCSREPTDDQPACPAAVCGESAKTKDVATGESKCSVCGAHWGTGWDIVYSGGDILLAAAALKFQVNAETIKKCILSLNELRKCKDMKSLMAVLEKDKESYKELGKQAGKKLLKSCLIQFLGAKVISGWLKEYFNQDVKEVIKNFRARWKFKICDMPKLPAALPGQKLLDYVMP